MYFFGDFSLYCHTYKCAMCHSSYTTQLLFPNSTRFCCPSRQEKCNVHQANIQPAKIFVKFNISGILMSFSQKSYQDGTSKQGGSLDMDGTFISCGFDEKSETFCSLWRYSLVKSFWCQLQRTEMKKATTLLEFYKYLMLQKLKKKLAEFSETLFMKQPSPKNYQNRKQ